MKSLHKFLAASALCGAVGVAGPAFAQAGAAAGGSAPATGSVSGAVSTGGQGTPESNATSPSAAQTDTGVNAAVQPGLSGAAVGNTGVNETVRPGLNAGTESAGVNATIRPGLTTGAPLNTEDVNASANQALERANQAAVAQGAPATPSLGSPEVPASGTASEAGITPNANATANAGAQTPAITGATTASSTASDAPAATQIMAAAGQRGNRSERAFTQALNRASRETAMNATGNAAATGASETR